MRILSIKESRIIDQWVPTQAGLPLSLLMENAGHAVAVAVADFYYTMGGTVVILAGTGNNGADGLVAMRHLREIGVPVRLHIVGDVAKGTELFALQLNALKAMEIPFTTSETIGSDSDSSLLVGTTILVDALVGTGLQGELRQPMANLLETVAAYVTAYPATKIIAVDTPSGVNGDTGSVASATLKADVTITFGAPKQGFYLYPAKSYMGEVRVAKLGIPWEKALPDEGAKTRALTADAVKLLLPTRTPTAHKGSCGHTLIIGGSEGMYGAPLMAAHGAIRTGAGKTTLAVPHACLDVITSRVDTAVMTGSYGNLLQLRMHGSEKDAVAVGPGLGRNEESATLIRNFVTTTDRPLVIDADGLWILGHIDRLEGALSNRERPAILTPHPGEFARLSGIAPDELEQDRIGIARSFAMKYNVVLVLKGAPTVVAAPNGDVAINTAGNAGMAIGGMGDVLTGVIASLLGQGASEWEAACAGVYLHSAAADILAQTKPQGFAPDDVADVIPNAIGMLRKR